MNLEPLRELERVAQEMRERRVNHGKSVSPTLIAWADRITALIAALGEGQEVGAVADERLCDFFADVGEVEQFMDDLCNVVTELTGDEGEDDPVTVLRRYIASPAHTSEARDANAARYEWLRNALYRDTVHVGEARLELDVIGACPSLEDFDAAIDAAMCQEAE